MLGTKEYSVIISPYLWHFLEEKSDFSNTTYLLSDYEVSWILLMKLISEIDEFGDVHVGVIAIAKDEHASYSNTSMATGFHIF